MKNKTYLLNTMLAAVLTLALLIAVLVRTFFPIIIIPALDLPNMVLISGLAVGAAQFLTWSFSCVFLPPMSTAIRTSVFSFVGALIDLLYIP